MDEELLIDCAEDYLIYDEDDEEAAPLEESDALETKISEENITQTIKLDYKLKTMEERAELVNRIVESTA